MIGTLGAAARDSSINRAESSFLSLFHGYFEALSFPESVNSLEVDRPTFLAEHTCDHPVAVARELANKLKNTSDQTRFVVFDTTLVTLAAASLADHSASPTFGHTASLHNRVDCRASSSRA